MFRSVRLGALAAILAAAPLMPVVAPGAFAEEESKTKLAAAEPAKTPEPGVAAATEAPVDAAAAASASPLNGRLIHQATGERLCIGGVLCPQFCTAKSQNCSPRPSLTIKLDGPAKINTIQLSAHDNIGKTRRSRLVFKINGKAVADTLVYRLGSTLSIDVGQTGELITIESAHQHNGFLRGGEEAVIWDVYVFGENRG